MIQNKHPLHIVLDRIENFVKALFFTKKPKIHLAKLESIIKSLIANTIFTDLEKVELYTNILLQPSISENYISKIIDDLSKIQDKNKANRQIEEMITKISLSLAKRLNGISNLKIDRIVDRLSIGSRLKVYHSITQSQRTIRTLDSIVFPAYYCCYAVTLLLLLNLKNTNKNVRYPSLYASLRFQNNFLCF